MNNAEALKKLDEIHSIMVGSNRAIFSGERIIVIGIGVLLIPLIETLTQHLTFGNETIHNSSFAIALIHTVFYWGLFTLVGRAIPFKKLDRAQLHPLIQKAFSISKPFFVALIGTIFAFSAIDQGQLIYPMVYIFLGFLFSVYGRFSIPAVSYIAWSYIVLGIVFTYLTKNSIENLELYFTLYQGLSLIVMGLFLRKASEAT